MDKSPRDHFTERHYAAQDIRGPLPFFNPTRRHIALSVADGKPPPVLQEKTVAGGDVRTTTAAPSSDGVYHVWRSRDNRKGRHAVAVTAGYADKATKKLPRATNTLVETLKGVGKMFVRYPVWDVSYDVALIFTIGSIVWCINGFFVWYPLYRPETEFPGEVETAGGITALIGATIFEVGAALAMLESVNENRTDCSGWALEEAVEDGIVLAKGHPECRHHHRNRRSLLGVSGGEGKGRGSRSPDEGDGADQEKRHPGSGCRRRWSWWPSWYEFRTHYCREIGFIANLSQMVGATIFWISGIVGMPSILGGLSTPAENGVFWLPQVVGGTGFIISSTLFMLEVQDKWYMPAPTVLGWHIGLWNLVGGIGFTLCGALGFRSDNAAVEYASTLATFVGSWAFLLGSLIQWFESLDKYPVTLKKGS